MEINDFKPKIPSYLPIVSVIIPCWGVLEFLDGLFEDLVNQTFKEAEFIFVNDGDKSLSGKLAELKAKDNRVVVIEQENGGASAARNHGIKKARGEWLVFVDSDDRLESYYLQSLYESVCNTKSDMAVAGFTFNYVKECNRVPSYICGVGNMKKEIPLKEAYPYLENKLIRGVPWNKIYRTSSVKKWNISFDLDIERIQDAIFNQDMYMEASYISLVKDCGYIYAMNDSGSLCSKYIEHFERDEQLLMEREYRLLEKLGYSQERIAKIRTNDEGLYCYFLVCNVFKRKSPLSFGEAVQRIKRELFDNEKLMKSYHEWKKQKGNNFIQIFHWAMKTKSPFCVALVFKIQYYIKYHFMSFYIKIKPWLKK